MKNLFSYYIRNKKQKANVEAQYDGGTVKCKCKKCGNTWSPMLKSGSRYYRNFWKCVKGCNSK